MEIKLSNKLAALALAITEAAMAPDDDLAPTAVAALITAANTEPLSIGEIAAVVGLTHSATVRLVDRLEAADLFRRQRRIGREVLVEITVAGRRRAQGLQERRLAKAGAFLEGLSADETELLDGLIGRMLRAHVARGHDRQRVCRMCSRAHCNCCFGRESPGGENHGIPDEMPREPRRI